MANSRKDIGRRVRAKSLKKLIADKKQNPDKYKHEMDEHSIYLGLKWDFEHKQLNPGKVEIYNKLKTKYEGEQK